MPRQGILLLRIGAVISSLVLLTSIVAFRAGLLPPQRLVRVFAAEPHPPSEHELNSIELIAHHDDQSQKGLSSDDAGPPSSIYLTGGVSEVKGSNTINFNQSDRPVANSPPLSKSEMSTRAAVQLEVEPVSEATTLLRKDAMTLMSSSKSIVILPRTPMEWDAAVDKLKANASNYFRTKDRNGDGKLSRGELTEHIWKKLEKRGAVEDGVVTPEGILKNYVWISQEK